ncbi:hypothetical protein JTE90_018566 [Oedothorax gibbosus]|uniref:Uncharacterized protein n=1 Tax=Oedothorax gibbosus TaxID=931172 RepID=A0AAV6U340_9ARAC|nr:hypothetical protein JTE90_018566 [Oedothorax gibbosus]
MFSPQKVSFKHIENEAEEVSAHVYVSVTRLVSVISLWSASPSGALLMLPKTLEFLIRQNLHRLPTSINVTETIKQLHPPLSRPSSPVKERAAKEVFRLKFSLRI